MRLCNLDPLNNTCIMKNEVSRVIHCYSYGLLRSLVLEFSQCINEQILNITQFFIKNNTIFHLEVDNFKARKSYTFAKLILYTGPALAVI